MQFIDLSSEEEEGELEDYVEEDPANIQLQKPQEEVKASVSGVKEKSREIFVERYRVVQRIDETDQDRQN